MDTKKGGQNVAQVPLRVCVGVYSKIEPNRGLLGPEQRHRRRHPRRLTRSQDSSYALEPEPPASTGAEERRGGFRVPCRKTRAAAANSALA